MYPETINAQQAIELFEKVMQRDNEKHMLLLKGEEYTGKSHLVRKVFRKLASDKYHACCIICDLRLSAQTDETILNAACRDLCETYKVQPRGPFQHFRRAFKDLETYLFPSYYPATQWKRSNPNLTFQNVTMRDQSSVNITQSAQSDSERRRDSLANLFLKDISRLTEQTIVFFVDDIVVEGLSNQRQVWIMNEFLGRLAGLTHVRVVVAGRSLPDMHTRYDYIYEEHHLGAVENLEDYESYCQRCAMELPKETIELFAIISKHRPGFFATHMDTISEYKANSQRRVSNG